MDSDLYDYFISEGVPAEHIFENVSDAYDYLREKCFVIPEGSSVTIKVYGDVTVDMNTQVSMNHLYGDKITLEGHSGFKIGKRFDGRLRFQQNFHMTGANKDEAEFTGDTDPLLSVYGGHCAKVTNMKSDMYIKMTSDHPATMSTSSGYSVKSAYLELQNQKKPTNIIYSAVCGRYQYGGEYFNSLSGHHPAPQKLYRYIDNQEWEIIESVNDPPPSYTKAKLFDTGNFLLYVGGNADYGVDVTYMPVHNKDIWKFNKITKEWSVESSSSPIETYACNAVYDNNDTIYVITNTKSYKYSIIAKTWTEITVPPSGIEDSQCAYKDGYIYVFGYKNYIKRLNINSMTWETVGSGYSRGRFPSVCVSGNKILVHEGKTTRPSKIFGILDTSTLSYTTHTTIPSKGSSIIDVVPGEKVIMTGKSGTQWSAIREGSDHFAEITFGTLPFAYFEYSNTNNQCMVSGDYVYYFLGESGGKLVKHHIPSDKIVAVKQTGFFNHPTKSPKLIHNGKIYMAYGKHLYVYNINSGATNYHSNALVYNVNTMAVKNNKLYCISVQERKLVIVNTYTMTHEIKPYKLKDCTFNIFDYAPSAIDFRHIYFTANQGGTIFKLHLYTFEVELVYDSKFSDYFYNMVIDGGSELFILSDQGLLYRYTLYNDTPVVERVNTCPRGSSIFLYKRYTLKTLGTGIQIRDTEFIEKALFYNSEYKPGDTYSVHVGELERISVENNSVLTTDMTDVPTDDTISIEAKFPDNKYSIYVLKNNFCGVYNNSVLFNHKAMKIKARSNSTILNFIGGSVIDKDKTVVVNQL